MVDKTSGAGRGGGGNVWLSRLGVREDGGCICVRCADTLRGYRFEHTGRWVRKEIYDLADRYLIRKLACINHLPTLFFNYIV